MTTASKKLAKRLNNMAVAKKKRKKRRTTSTTMAARSPRRRTTRRKKRTTRLSSGGGGSSKVGFGKAMMNTLAGASGGAIYTAPKFMFKMNPWVKAGWGTALSIGLHMFKQPNMGSGAAGAMIGDLASSMFSKSLNDLEDVEYVDPDTLSDTGFCDEDGNAIVMDDDGTVYALSDGGDYEAIGDVYSLQDMNMQGVSNPSFPLQDPYALQGGGSDPYALQGGY